MTGALSDTALDQLFRQARSYNGWLDTPVSDDEIATIYALLKMGPTSANQSPARFVWVRSEEGKARLVDCVAPGNKAKVLAAPATVIIGYDLEFHEQLPWLFPHTDARAWFADKDEFRRESAVRNATLQGAYLMLAARALGLDCGPMSGFDQAAATAAFFADQPTVRADFLCSVGHGDPASIFGRSPRPEFNMFNRLA